MIYRGEDACENLSCAWRTGDRRCAITVYSQKHCSFHQYWLRLVERGVLGRQQKEEFFDWWEQFQPYSPYGDRPGLWWADKDLLWQALTGHGPVPVTTLEIENELYLRRIDVRRFLDGLPILSADHKRLDGCGLPKWERSEWQAKAVKWK